MQVRTYETREQWLNDRPGRITGSKLNDTVTFRGSTIKTGVYQLIADKLALADGSFDGADRGNNLEVEAVAALGEHLGLTFNTDLVMWFSDENEDMAFSPDGFTDDLTVCAEAKCLSSALHIEAVIKNDIPAKHWNEYHLQRVQAFIVNEKLQTHYIGFYDPRITARPLVVLKTTRQEVEADIAKYHLHQRNTLQFVNEWVERLAF